nr:hypothetical protein [Pandoravirus aubagnensis]
MPSARYDPQRARSYSRTAIGLSLMRALFFLVSLVLAPFDFFLSARPHACVGYSPLLTGASPFFWIKEEQRSPALAFFPQRLHVARRPTARTRRTDTNQPSRCRDCYKIKKKKRGTATFLAYIRCMALRERDSFLPKRKSRKYIGRRSSFLS